MNYWIDRSGSTHHNVIAITDNAVLVGSGDKSSLDQMDEQLAKGVSPLEVLGTDDLLTIPFAQIQSVVSRSTDPDVDLKYKARKEIEDTALDFETTEDADGFLNAIDALLPEQLVKSDYQQSALMAMIAPLGSLLLGGAALYLFYNKLRTVALIVGGLWILASLYMLYRRTSNPPRITRWAIKGRYARKTWQGLKTGFSLLIAAVVVIAFSSRFPDTHGPANIFQQLDHEQTLTADDFDALLKQGADVNYQQDGETVLARSLYWENDIVSAKLIEAGADVTVSVYDENMLEFAINNSASLDVIQLILEGLEPRTLTVNGMSLSEFTEYSKEEGNQALANLIAHYL